MNALKRVAVALSGGIDSAVSALILKNKGFDVTGAFIRCWRTDDGNTIKSVNEDAENAKWICNKLRIPFVEVDLTKEYWPQVYEHLIADYNIGFTPNPDLICNEQIIFRAFHRYCLNELEVDAVATGHYVKSSFGSFLEKRNTETKARLLRSTDKINDQTYVLSRISQEVLQRTMFPVGELTKNQVKAIAKDNAFNKILEQEESSDICFLRSPDFKCFVSKYVLGNPGKVVNVNNGQVVGEHQGLHHYSKGEHYKNEYYVVDNDGNDYIFVAPKKDHPAMYCRSLTLSMCHWLYECPLEFTNNRLYHSSFQYAYDKPLLDCLIVNLFDYPEYGFGFLESKEPMYAVLPGQYAVLYQGEECVGSFKIQSTGPSDMFHDESKV